MNICQHCHAIVPDNNVRCIDCGTPVTDAARDFAPPPAGALPVAVPASEVSPLADLDRELDPDDFLRQLLGSDETNRVDESATPPPPASPTPESSPPSHSIPPTPTAFEPDSFPAPPAPPLDHGVTPHQARAAVHPADDIDALLAARPVPNVPPPPIARPTRLPEHQHLAPNPPSGLPRGSRVPEFAKSGDAPTHVGDVYSVTARSNRLGTAATLGRSEKHSTLVGAAIVGAAVVFMLGAVVGWASWSSPDAALAQASAEAVSPTDSSVDAVPDEVRGSFVRVEGAYCNDRPALGFVTSKVVVIPAGPELTTTGVRLQYFTGEIDAGVPLGVTPDGRFLVIKPDTTPRSGLERGLSGAIADGSNVTVVNLDSLAQSGDNSLQSLQVVSSDRTFDLADRTYFDQQGLNPFMPIVDGENRLRATVSEDGTHGVGIGTLGLDISILKLNPESMESGCVPAKSTFPDDSGSDLTNEGE